MGLVWKKEIVVLKDMDSSFNNWVVGKELFFMLFLKDIYFVD